MRYGFFVGIDNYTNDITRLQCACNDATELYGKFCASGFDRTVLIPEREASSSEILRRLRGMCRQMKSGDLLVFYFAGHGRELNNEHYLLANDSYADQSLYTIGSIPMSALVQSTNVPGVHRLFILDCCRDNLLSSRSAAYTCEYSRNISLDCAVRAQSGFIPPLILNSCAAGERAYEDLNSRHGYFTNALLRAIGNASVKCFSDFRRFLSNNLGIAKQNICWNGDIDSWDNVPLFKDWENVPSPPPPPPPIPRELYAAMSAAEDWETKFKKNKIPVSAAMENFKRCADMAEQKKDYSAALEYLKSFSEEAEKVFNSMSDNVQKKDGVKNWLIAILLLIVIGGVLMFVNMKSSAPSTVTKPGAESNPTVDIEKMYASAQQLYERKKYTEAVELFQKLADKGHKESQYYLGVCYDLGNGVSQDYAKAVSWYEKSAKQGNAQAQYNLGLCYDLGKGVSQDYAKAVYWYEKSARQGFAQAQYNLGGCYNNGEGVSQDYGKAVYWYEKSAQQGKAQAQYNLGLCYYNGRGVSQDYGKAVYWYEKSARQGNARAQYNLGLCYEYGKGVSKDIKKAKYWYQKAVDQGHENAKKALEIISKK